MNRETLERLAKNPNYKMSARQIQMLDEYRKHDSNIYTHSNGLERHPVTVEAENLEPVVKKKRKQNGNTISRS